MIRFTPDTAPGLLAHELRLSWRAWFGRRPNGKRRGVGQAVLAVVFLVFLTAMVGTPVAYAMHATGFRTSPIAPVLGTAILVAILTLMLSQTLIGVVRTFYERDDLDLLLTSPVSPMVVLVVKSAGIALTAAAMFSLFLTPVIAPLVVMDGAGWLGLYPVIAAAALSATAIGLILALGMFAMIGPRATKTWAQLLAAVVGAGFFIASQVQVLLGADRSEGLWLRLTRQAEAGEILLPPGVDLPVRGAFGDPVAVIATLTASLALFALVAFTVGRRFAVDAAAARGAGVRRRATPGRPGQFGTGPFRALLRKELRLLLRDPGLISQVLMRMLYFVPIAFLVMRSRGDEGVGGVLALAGGAAAIVFMAGQVGASLSWITVSAEDSPDLLNAAPVTPGAVWRGKLSAAMLPLALIVALPIAALAWASPSAAVYGLLGSVASGLSAGMINIWMQKPSRRSEFRRRRSASVAASLAEALVGGLFAAATGLAVYGFAWWAAILPAVIAFVILAALRRPEGEILARLAEEAA